MKHEAEIGSIVLIHDPRIAVALDRQDEAGVVLQRRRGGARIGFLSDGGSVWVEDGRLLLHPAAAPGSSMLRSVSRALGGLRAEEAWFEELDPKRLELHVRCLGFDGGELEELVRTMGASLKGWSTVPYGMAFITLVLELEDSGSV